MATKSRNIKHIKWSAPIERPKAESWKPHKGELRVFVLERIITDGKFGTSYLVKDMEDDKGNGFFLPHHVTLQRLLEAAKVREGHLIMVKCLKKGSKKEGDFYDYELRTAKANAPF